MLGVCGKDRFTLHKVLRACSLGLCLLFGLAAAGQAVWHTEVVDDGAGSDVGKSASLVKDHDGDLHVAYYDNTHHTVWYAFRPVGEHHWYKMQLPSSKAAYAYVALAVDNYDHPHLAYVAGAGVTYATWNGKTWSSYVIDPVRAQYSISIQLDAQQHPRISYYQEYGVSQYVQHLKYAAFDGHQWFVQTVDWRFGTGKYNSIIIDSSGNAHVAYNRMTGDLLYASWNGKAWQFDDVDPGSRYSHYVGNGVSAALDSSGYAHIAYLDVKANTVKYASFDGTHWQTETIDQLVERALLDHVSLKLDRQGRPHVAYYDAGLGVLKYAVRTGKTWQIQVADRSGSAGMTPSLFLDANDRPYIAYYDVARHMLKVAEAESRTMLEAGK